MEKNQSFSQPELAGLRYRLEAHLSGMFASNTISKYLAIKEDDTALRIINCSPNMALTFPQIKLAYGVWLSMCATDRHAVLGKFHRLYSGLLIAAPTNRKTLIFSALFIHEFAAILIERLD